MTAVPRRSGQQCLAALSAAGIVKAGEAQLSKLTGAFRGARYGQILCPYPAARSLDPRARGQIRSIKGTIL
jgi:hypothetical protein